MKKIILLATLFFMTIMAYSQTTVDIVKEINKSTYESITGPKKELNMDYETERRKAEFLDDFIDDFNLSSKIDDYKKSCQDSKEVIDLKNKITLLEIKVNDLQYGIDRRDEEIINLKLKYRVASKILYFMTNYNCSINELNDFFTEKELKIAQDIAKEWKRLYE